MIILYSGIMAASRDILIVEDDRTIVLGLNYTLSQEGYEVTSCSTVAEAMAFLNAKVFDLALLDLSLPDGSGYEICRHIRRHSAMPVVFLTAHDEEVNVVMGLDMGADDYITKPFRVRELLSRLRTVLRRAENAMETAAEVYVGDITINTKQAKVMRREEELQLTALEYRLLLTLATNKGQVLSRSQLLDGIWDIGGEYVTDNTLSVYIKRLRDKIEDDPANPTKILTIRGYGYKAGN